MTEAWSEMRGDLATLTEAWNKIPGILKELVTALGELAKAVDRQSTSGPRNRSRNGTNGR
jgi:hypothetical protein